MPALGIVKPFDVIEHIGPRLVPTTVGFPVHPLSLEAGEEALDRRVVPAVTPTTLTHPTPSYVNQ